MKPKYQTRNITISNSLRPYCILILTLTLLTVCYIFWKTPDNTKNSENEEPIKPSSRGRNSPDIHYKNQRTESRQPKNRFEGDKIVHLDLKGAPPKVGYYFKFFPLIKQLGATGVLIEYEDMFPYNGELVNISATNAYSRKDIETINKLAKANGLIVIPLIQTFGHMEFILKLKEYKEFREVSAFPQAICPTHERTIPLITTMIEQIVTAHPDSNMIHIGADEVYYLGQCGRCVDEMIKNSLTKNQLFLEHINKVVDIVNRLYPNLRVLMWDDQLRSIIKKDLKKVDFNFNIEPVVWKYTKEVYEDLGPTLWDGYSNVFKNVWAASAFKGATGSNEFVTDVNHYLQNHRGWLSIISDYHNVVNFRGIIITGWQRYDHFSVLCELLPVAIPSLAMCLRMLSGYNSSPLSPPLEVARILNCQQPYALMGPAFGTPKCSYPGGDVLENVLHLQQLKQELENILEDSRVRGWMNDYNIKHSFSSPSHVKHVFSSLNRIKNDLEDFKLEMTTSLLEIYDEYTVNEWKETYLKPLDRSINKLWNGAKGILIEDSWPRRPLKEL